MPTIQTEVEKLTGVKPGRREDEQDFLNRVVKALNDVPDKQYNKLSKDAQEWAEEATEAYNAEKDIPDFPGEDDDEADEDQIDDTEDTDQSDEDEPEDDESEVQSDEDGDEPATDDEPEDDEMPDTQTNEGSHRRKAAPPPQKRAAAKGNTSKPAQKTNTKTASANKAGGALVYARQLLVKSPDMAVADLAEKVKAKGFAVSLQTLHTTRSGFRQDLRALQDAGLLKKKMV